MSKDSVMNKEFTCGQESWIKTWENTRKNKWKFIIIEGVIFGILLPLFNLVIRRLINGVWDSLIVVLIFFALGLISGLLIGIYLWRVYEKRYKKYLKIKEKQKEETNS